MSDSFLPQQPPQQPQTMHVITHAAEKNPKGVIRASWILLGLTCLGSLVPAVGFGVWVIAFPILLTTLILGIVAIVRGGVAQGVLVLVATLIIVPIFISIAPIVSTGVAVGAAIEASEIDKSQNETADGVKWDQNGRIEKKRDFDKELEEAGRRLQEELEKAFRE